MELIEQMAVGAEHQLIHFVVGESGRGVDPNFISLLF